MPYGFPFQIRSDDSYVAYLPLAHVFELTCELIAILYGVKIGYSSATTLTDNSPSIIPGEQGDCAILQPTIMAAVPLMLDRVKKAVTRKCKDKGALSARVLELAIDETVKRYKRGQDATIYDKDIFAQIRSVIGGRVRLIATGSAPLSPETHSFIRAALGCVVLQGYGLTESCAAATSMEITDLSTGEVGCPVAGAYVKLVDWAEGGYFVKENKGEIILGGEMISAGYFKNELLTSESFFEEGGIRWFRTGDIGEVTPRGTFKIIDRKKDLVKLQNGEYISLGKVETELKTMDIIDNICAYGNSLQDFIVALVQPNMGILQKLASECGRPTTDSDEMVNDPALTDVVLGMIQSHSKTIGFLRKEIPLRIKLCAEEWTPDTGLVTAAMKLCRREIQKKFQSDLDKLYE